MADQTAEFEWRSDGEEAEIALYAPDKDTAESAFERALPAARLPGVESPVYAAASERRFGWVAASSSHVAPEIVSEPARGVLLAADISLGNIGLPPEGLPRLLARNLTETRLPGLNEAGVGRVCALGAHAAAEDGLIEEEDLAFLDLPRAEPDSLSRRALFAGTRDWSIPGRFGVYSVREILDADGAESLGLEADMLVFVLDVGSGDLGRLSLGAHRGRIAARVENGEFDADAGTPAAPLDTEEAVDSLVASSAAANFAAGRAALLTYALRRAMGEVAGSLRPLAAWAAGGLVEREGLTVHRRELAALGQGGAVVSGESVASGTGAMLGSAPAFGVSEVEGRWPWEEAGLLERTARLRSLGESR